MDITREPRVNDKIRAREVRLVDPNGGQIGLKSIEEARWLADQLGLDLVEVAADARPPVVRMMDYGKFKYEQSVKAREARKNQSRTVIKEVQFRPKISGNDFDVKKRRVIKFLNAGDKVKVTMRFRGREVTHPEIGMEILNRLIEQVGELAIIESNARLEGRQMTMVLGPSRSFSQRKDDESGEETDDLSDLGDTTAEVATEPVAASTEAESTETAAPAAADPAPEPEATPPAAEASPTEDAGETPVAE